MIVIQVLLCFCYMCVIPYLIGCLFVDGQKDVGNVTILRTVAGLMISYAVYEILEVGFQLKNQNTYQVCAKLSSSTILRTLCVAG